MSEEPEKLKCDKSSLLGMTAEQIKEFGRVGEQLLEKGFNLRNQRASEGELRSVIVIMTALLLLGTIAIVGTVLAFKAHNEEAGTNIAIAAVSGFAGFLGGLVSRR